MVCMVEVKCDDDSPRQLEVDEQIKAYMLRAFEHGSLSDDFRGYLVMGQEVLVYGRNPNSAPGNPIVVALGKFSMLDDNDPF